jgi:ribonuclease Z
LILLGSGAAFPPRERENTSLLLHWAGGIWLIDCGASPHRRLRLAGFDPESLRGIVITHDHPDHLYGLPSLIHCLIPTPPVEPLPILAPPRTLLTARMILEAFDLADRPGLPLEFITTPCRPGSSEEEPVHQVDGLRLWCEPVEHGREAIGVRAEAAGRVIAISGDTAPCAGIGRLTRGAHLLVHEATFLEDTPGGTAPGHSTARDAGIAAREAGVEVLVLTHFLEATVADPAAVVAEAAEVFDGKIVVGEDFGRYQV